MSNVRLARFVAAPLLCLLFAMPAFAGSQTLGFTDLMKFHQIKHPSISRDGAWISYELEPGRGESVSVARSADDDLTYRIDRCADPVLSGDSQWMACKVPPTQAERDKAGGGRKKDDGPRDGMALVSLRDGSVSRFDDVESFHFSDGGRWLAWKHFATQKDQESEVESEGSGTAPVEKPIVQESEAAEQADDEDRHRGTNLILRELATGTDTEIADVTAYAFDEPGNHLAYAVAGPFGKPNGLYIRSLSSDSAGDTRPLHKAEAGRYTELTWAEASSRLAFVAAVDDDLHDTGPAEVWAWDGSDAAQQAQLLAKSDAAPTEWRIPSKNELTWSRDGRRLFFGYEWIDPVREARRQQIKERKRAEREEALASDQTDVAGTNGSIDEEGFDPYDVEALLEQRELDVWHWDDPLIKTHERKQWDEKEKDRVYFAVAHLESGGVVRLTDREVPDLEPTHNDYAALAFSELPYQKLQTWDGNYADLYHVQLATGERQLVAEKLDELELDLYLSPSGRFVVYWRESHWHLWDSQDGVTRNLTRDLGVPFANEDDDYPADDPGYGIAEWVSEDGVDKAVLIYDKYDLWRFSLDGSKPTNLTRGEGRKTQWIFRIQDLDPDRDWVGEGARLLLHGYNDKRKNDSFWEARSDRPSLKRLLEEDRRFRFKAKAENADRVLFTRESYNDYPDLWVATTQLSEQRKLSEANPQIDQFAWGEAELVEWRSADGVPLQGVLIKPGNYEPGKRYPVLVYFYRFFSQRLHEFNAPVINHRPSFPLYASDGYAVFLPDVRFEIGRPGNSTVQAIVPGVQKLIDMGIADPEAIGLHGHSWSGYTTAYAITQTDFFKAAVAGAPVSNMTSAYSGIRLGSGRARQFQYEEGQSRIGETLDQGLQKYIENSPVFHVRHINTPLLIQFGDEDDAVPWQQGVELYLAMRRLEKDVVFLQYRGEPHHLKKFPNRLDYAIKMKAFFDHHLKGEAAPAWMEEGVPFRGE